MANISVRFVSTPVSGTWHGGPVSAPAPSSTRVPPGLADLVMRALVDLERSGRMNGVAK